MRTWRLSCLASGVSWHWARRPDLASKASRAVGMQLPLRNKCRNLLRRLKATDPDATVHIFSACPNSVLFFLGQQHQGIAPCVVYEFDFDRRGDKTYQPSFVMD